MVIIACIASYLVIGLFAARLYCRILDKYEDALIRERHIEFRWTKTAFWAFLMLIAWWFVFPYERITDFRRWKYPYCNPDCRSV